MPFLEEFERLGTVFLAFSFAFTFKGACCELLLSPVGDSLVYARLGRNVTLAVSFIGASDPALTWFKGNVIVGTWTVGSTDAPDIYGNYSSVLRIEKNGSLTFVNVPPNYTDVYTIELSKSGEPRVHITFTLKILYGPDEPALKVYPPLPFYVQGDSLSLSCQANGFPLPTVEWVFGGEVLSRKGVLNLTIAQTSQGGVYTCQLLNAETNEKRQKNMTLTVYARPVENPECSVQSVNTVDLQYHCGWVGGTPPAQLTFPALSNTSSGAGNFSLTVVASDNLNGKTIMCVADHPVEQNKCNITASNPADFLPIVRTTVDSDGKIMVTIQCFSEALPKAAVSWLRGSDAVTSGSAYQISSSTTELRIRYYNVSNILLTNYTCTCSNPLGSKRREIQLQGPSISDSSLFPNQDGTIITLTWEVPPTSVVTGFDVQMKGPDLKSKNHNGLRIKGSPDGYRTIQQKPGSARSADIFVLDPNLTYRFRVIPRARTTEGVPSKVHRIGPGEGLSGPAIAGIAAGIPCSLLFLCLLGGLIYLAVYCNKNRGHQPRYPVSRAVEKVKSTQTDITPNILKGGLNALPDYNRLQQPPSEKSVGLSTFVPPPPVAPVRVATTV